MDMFKLKYTLQSKYGCFVLQDTIAPNDYLGMDVNKDKILWSVKSLSVKDFKSESELALKMMEYGNMFTIYTYSEEEQKIRFAANRVKVTVEYQ